jgi:hypothetical protein
MLREPVNPLIPLRRVTSRRLFRELVAMRVNLWIDSKDAYAIKGERNRERIVPPLPS